MTARDLAKIILTRIVPDSVYFAINARIATRDIVSRRRWEPEISTLPGFVHPGDTVVDIGGNHGLYAYHLSRLVGPSGRVHSFEPLPPNLRILNHTVDSLGLRNVTVHAAACGEEDAAASFCIPLRHGVPYPGCAHQGTDGVNFECRIVRLDDVIDSKISFMKCDVEGAELFVLRGAERILRQHRPVLLIEAHDHTARFGYSQQALFDFAAGHGYRFFDASLQEQDAFRQAGNYFFVPAEVSL